MASIAIFVSLLLQWAFSIAIYVSLPEGIWTCSTCPQFQFMSTKKPSYFSYMMSPGHQYLCQRSMGDLQDPTDGDT